MPSARSRREGASAPAPKVPVAPMATVGSVRSGGRSSRRRAIPAASGPGPISEAHVLGVAGGGGQVEPLPPLDADRGEDHADVEHPHDGKTSSELEVKWVLGKGP